MCRTVVTGDTPDVEDTQKAFLEDQVKLILWTIALTLCNLSFKLSPNVSKNCVTIYFSNVIFLKLDVFPSLGANGPIQNYMYIKCVCACVRARARGPNSLL
jgi:hypothetical protein